ncbi:DNA cytosine methyltransferase [Chelativorans sp. AA-79]|uniref:DNA cytosine methyltransferase n=1 Tax=Chelativorans sp. AA-79 TaxID=3028735 RepID=UPI0023F6CA6E|nr:DNA cytosine methyltransferase [Chelativorans sp. AA-79]WEX11758.1 DNA cytosine methyltransferase [Chelativorans sp. AA-79]
MKTAAVPFQVVDLFAGPGGLAEGFASVRDADGFRPFNIALSVEKDATAHKTLRFRAFLRQFGDSFPDRYYSFLNDEIDEPDWETLYPEQWQAAEAEALLLELGEEGASDVIAPKLQAIRESSGDRTIVIGGPPCQAYSIAGRARNRGIAEYDPAKDKRHFLYKEYIAALEKLKPAAFVMENVKGMLSTSVGGEDIFKKVLADLAAVGGNSQTYEFFAFAPGPGGIGHLKLTRKPKDFVIRSEVFSVPQARHRIIIVGVRRDLALLKQQTQSETELTAIKVTVADVLRTLPAIRSGVSKADSVDAWKSALARSVQKVIEATAESGDDNYRLINQRSRVLAKQIANGEGPTHRSSSDLGALSERCPQSLREWIMDRRLKLLKGHLSRGHMESDLARYFFAAVFAEVTGRSPVAKEFPPILAPNHKNWDSGVFSDRFRVQIWDAPSTTITSHLAKDGHYFIHPDPMQCRALTLREAARLQTFPDNYRFFGNQTEQFVQVGNAVPPFLARQIGEALHALLSGAIGAVSSREGESASDTATEPMGQAAE